MNDFRKDLRFSDVFFFRDKLEEKLGISFIENDEILEKHKKDVIKSYIDIYKSRVTIESWEAASFIVYNHPNAERGDSTVVAYQKSMFDAVENEVLKPTKYELNIHDELCYVEFSIKEIGSWAKKHQYNWVLPTEDDEVSTANHVVIDQNASVNKQLKNEITKLNEQLKQAHKEIAELKSQAPILLGKFIKNDPLQLAIQIRNKEWANYDPSSNSQKPKKDGIIADLQKNHNVSSKQLASSIEKVACPIERKK